MTTSSAPRVLVNGEPADRVAVDDRGFAVGDGLFETVAVRAGTPRYWFAHRERLETGCDRLGIPAPDMDGLRSEAAAAIGDAASGTLRLTVTRGRGPRGYAPPSAPRPTRVVAFQAQCEPPAGTQPLAVRWCTTRLALQPQLAGIKHLNRLEQVMARAEWQDPAIGEGVMCATDGRVVEGVMSNLFVVEGDGQLATPALDDCGVAGVMRQLTLQAAADLGVSVRVARLEPTEVAHAAGLFMTNAVRGLVPVARLGERTLAAPEPLLGQLAAQVERLDA